MLQPSGRVDFSRLAREIFVLLKRIEQKHSVSSSIEMLGAFRYGKIIPPSDTFAIARYPVISRAWKQRAQFDSSVTKVGGWAARRANHSRWASTAAASHAGSNN